MNWFAAAPFPFYLFGIAYRPLLFVGFALQTAYLFSRGFELGRIPLVGVHDTLNFLSASIVVFSLPFYKTIGKRRDFYITLAVLCAAFTAFALLSKPHFRPLPPVLQTYWFELHVTLSFFSYALFAIAAALGGVFFRSGDAAHERLQYRTALIGYSLFSLSMIFGGIWAHLAWGSYWLWTPKELWTTLLWVFYGLYLHARLTPGWAGKTSAALGIAGFFVVMFTYLGVGLLMKSSHSF